MQNTELMAAHNPDHPRRPHADQTSKAPFDPPTLEAAHFELVSAQRRLEASLDYASLIQQAILPDQKLQEYFGDDHFVLWQPRDVVGGDFYTFHTHHENYLIGVFDCAGHGVPGALMTMLVRAALDASLHTMGPEDPAAILARVDAAIKGMLKHARRSRALATNTDAALVYVDRAAGTLHYSGARIDLFLSDGREVSEYRGNRRSLGEQRAQPFENTTVPLTPGLTVYLCSDGVLDQANGQGHAFGVERFRELLVSYKRCPLPEQAAGFSAPLTQFRQGSPQRDDMTLLSFRTQPGVRRDRS